MSQPSPIISDLLSLGIYPPKVIQVLVSRSLLPTDNGQTLECAAAVTITVPVGLQPNFQCWVIPNGTTTFASDGTAKIMGGTSSVTRASATAANTQVEIVARGSAVDSYIVTGV